MKTGRYIIAYLLLAGITAINLTIVEPVKNADAINLQQLRKEKDYFIKNSEDSPLEPEVIEQFDKLQYFPHDPGFVLDCGVQMFTDKDTLELEVLGSDSKEKSYFIRYGRAIFSYEQEVFRLIFYRHVDDLENEHFFVPFGDHTNGFSTFSRGRYMDLYVDSTSIVQQVDFNLSYNSFCAYNTNYNCPVPPRENYLPFSVEAGEKKFDLESSL